MRSDSGLLLLVSALLATAGCEPEPIEAEPSPTRQDFGAGRESGDPSGVEILTEPPGPKVHPDRDGRGRGGGGIFGSDNEDDLA